MSGVLLLPAGDRMHRRSSIADRASMDNTLAVGSSERLSAFVLEGDKAFGPEASCSAQRLLTLSVCEQTRKAGVLSMLIS